MQRDEATIVHNALLRASVAYFMRHVLRMNVDEFHVVLSEAVSRERRLATQAARDAGKSAFFSYATAIHMAWKYPGSLGYIYSSTLGLAADLLTIIKDGNRQTDPLTGEEVGLFAVEEIPELAWMVDRKRCIWQQAEIQFTNGSRIRARGWHGATRGPHPLWVICDDVLDEKALWSPIQRDKATDFLKTAVTNMVLKSGWLFVVGTPFHESDLYGWCAQNPAYTFLKFPGLIEVRPQDAGYDPEEGGDVQLRALVPSRHTVRDLQAKKVEIGSVAFAREILCEPISDDLTLFPSSLFVGEVMAHHVAWSPSYLQCQAWGWETYVGVDIAESADVGADYFVLTVLALDKHGNRYLIDYHRARGLTFQEQLTTIADYNARYRPVVVFIEANQMQRIWPEELRRTTDIPVRPFHTLANNKNSLATGVPSLRTLLENLKLRFARGDEAAILATDVYIDELRHFGWFQGKLQGTGAHDDCVMSLWIAVEATRHATFRYTFGDDVEDTRELTEGVLNAEDPKEQVEIAIRLILAGGEVVCSPEQYTDTLRPGLEDYVQRLTDVNRMRMINYEIARLDDEFELGDSEEPLLILGAGL